LAPRPSSLSLNDGQRGGAEVGRKRIIREIQNASRDINSIPCRHKDAVSCCSQLHHWPDHYFKGRGVRAVAEAEGEAAAIFTSPAGRRCVLPTLNWARVTHQFGYPAAGKPSSARMGRKRRPKFVVPPGTGETQTRCHRATGQIVWHPEKVIPGIPYYFLLAFGGMLAAMLMTSAPGEERCPW